jgi:hypothetical protein
MNNIDDLRATLFESIKLLKEGKLDVAQAKAISEMSQVVINSAKVELDFMREFGGKGTGFVPDALAAHGQPRLVKGVR